MLTTINLTILFPITSAKADDCESSKEDGWLCKGDKAWFNGYLVKVDKLKNLIEKEGLLDAMKQERDEFKELADQYQKQRNQFKDHAAELQKLLELSASLRDEYRGQRDRMEEELKLVEEKYTVTYKEKVEAEESLAEAWAPWEVGLLVAGIGVLTLGTGIGVGFILAK